MFLPISNISELKQVPFNYPTRLFNKLLYRKTGSVDFSPANICDNIKGSNAVELSETKVPFFTSLITDKTCIDV